MAARVTFPPRNSGKGTPAFNEERIFWVFFFLADFHSQANKMESNKKFQQKGGAGEEEREDTAHLNLS